MSPDSSRAEHHSLTSGVVPVQDGAKFKSVRRIFRIIDLVSEQKEGLTAKQLAQETNISLSNCYHLINMLLDEGYIEKLPHRKGYRLGPAISLLYENYVENSLDARIERIIDELARRTGRHAYYGLFSSGVMTVMEVKTPPRNPPVEIVRSSQGASHSLALGKVLLASMGPEGVEEYMDSYGLEAFTPRTIINPRALRSQLETIRAREVATDIEEFTDNLCCVASPIKDTDGCIRGAIGISTWAKGFGSERPRLISLAQQAAKEVSTLL